MDGHQILTNDEKPNISQSLAKPVSYTHVFISGVSLSTTIEKLPNFLGYDAKIELVGKSITVARVRCPTSEACLQALQLSGKLFEGCPAIISVTECGVICPLYLVVSNVDRLATKEQILNYFKSTDANVKDPVVDLHISQADLSKEGHAFVYVTSARHHKQCLFLDKTNFLGKQISVQAGEFSGSVVLGRRSSQELCFAYLSKLKIQSLFHGVTDVRPVKVRHESYLQLELVSFSSAVERDQAMRRSGEVIDGRPLFISIMVNDVNVPLNFLVKDLATNAKNSDISKHFKSVNVNEIDPVVKDLATNAKNSDISKHFKSVNVNEIDPVVDEVKNKSCCVYVASVDHLKECLDKDESYLAGKKIRVEVGLFPKNSQV